MRVADFVLPGSFTVAVSSILFYLTKNRYPAALVAFLYSGGIFFHILYLTGIFPQVIIVPEPMILIVGIVFDALAILAIHDYFRRARKSSG